MASLGLPDGRAENSTARGEMTIASVLTTIGMLILSADTGEVVAKDLRARISRAVGEQVGHRSMTPQPVCCVAGGRMVCHGADGAGNLQKLEW
jgi:hypothetical protein